MLWRRVIGLLAILALFGVFLAISPGVSYAAPEAQRHGGGGQGWHGGHGGWQGWYGGHGGWQGWHGGLHRGYLNPAFRGPAVVNIWTPPVLLPPPVVVPVAVPVSVPVAVPALTLPQWTAPSPQLTTYTAPAASCGCPVLSP